MKRCEMREVHTWSVCVELQCDICGRKAEHPENGTFEWGSAGSAAGTLNWFYTIDGDDNPDELNFCYECAYIGGPAGRGERRRSGRFRFCGSSGMKVRGGELLQ